MCSLLALGPCLIISLVYILRSQRPYKETNLVLGEVKVEVGTWELGLEDTFPEPVHWGAIGDVR